jgi:hypothetical protein
MTSVIRETCKFATAILVVSGIKAVEKYQSVPPRHEILFFYGFRAVVINERNS